MSKCFKYSKKSRFCLSNPGFDAAQSPHLSLKAKGLFFLMSTTGECSLTELFEKCRDDSYASIKKTLHELECFKLIRVREIRKLTYIEYMEIRKELI